MHQSHDLDRRALLCLGAAGLAAALAPRVALAAAPSHLAFEIWRNDQRIGSHSVSIQATPDAMHIAIVAELLVKFGPIPIFRYHHEGQETWTNGRFVELATQTVSNGRRQQLTAKRTANGISIDTGHGAPAQAPADAHPLTHWNAAVLEGPLFNPQTGAMLHEQVARTPDQTVHLADGQTVTATRYALSGRVEITDWYDGKDAWTALRGRAPDGSYIEYRRVA